MSEHNSQNPDNTPGDALDWTPGEACRAAASKADKDDFDAAFIILLNNQQDGYATHFYNSGFSVSEAVALLEVQKSRLLELINNAEQEQQ